MQAFYTFIVETAKQKKVSLQALAQHCHIGRTTLYRIMKGESRLTEDIEKGIVSFLRLTDAEVSRMATCLVGREGVADTDYLRAFSILDDLVYPQSGHPATHATANFATYARGEKYLRSFAEVCQDLGQALQAASGNIEVYIQEAADDAVFGMLEKLLSLVMQTGQPADILHFVNFPAQQPAHCAMTFKNCFQLMRHAGYQVYYHSHEPALQAYQLLGDCLLLSFQTAAGQQQYMISLARDDLSTCLHLDNGGSYNFFLSAFLRIKRSCQSADLRQLDLKDLNQEIAQMEGKAPYALLQNGICPNLIPPAVQQKTMDALSVEEKIAIIYQFSGLEAQPYEVEQYAAHILNEMEKRYQLGFRRKHYNIFSREGITQFAKKGSAAAFAPGVTYDIKQRRDTLQSLIRRLDDANDPVEVFISERSFVGGLSILASRGNGVQVDFTHLLRPDGQFNIMLRNPMIASLFFRYFSEYLPFKHLYSREKTKRFLQGLLDSF